MKQVKILSESRKREMEIITSQSNKLTRWVAALMATGAVGVIPAAHAEIELGNGISVTGFLDMSYYKFSSDDLGDFKSVGIDQFETDFKFTGSGGVTAQVDIEYGEQGEGSGDETFVEQAFVTKAFTDQFSVKLGRFLSYSGWEAEEPTGLMQYSATGYGPYFYGYYQNGVSASYTGSKFAVMGSVVTSAFDPTDRNSIDGVDDKTGYEVGLAVMPVEGLTGKAFYIKDEDSDTEIINTWVSYAAAGFTFAGEYSTVDYGPNASNANGDGDGFLLMGNYTTGPFGITLRYHDFEIKDAAGDSVSDSAFTLSPSYKVGDNWLLVAEYRKDNYEVSGSPDADGTSYALEALFTF